MTSSRVSVVAALSLLAAIHSAPAAAQAGNGGIASATVSAMAIEDGASPSIAGAVGYRFNPIVALGDSVIFPSPTITVGSDDGHATIFTTNLRLTVPTRSRRLSPYLLGGAGVGTITDHLQYTIIYPPIWWRYHVPVLNPAN
jgi:outer membrane protein with beta-barrel domain